MLGLDDREARRRRARAQRSVISKEFLFALPHARRITTADGPGGCETPVFACWIEGGWGSYFSFKGGPPTKNKRPDFRRPIRIGVVGPFTVDPAMLADHMATRTFLMRQVNAAREPLGLEPLPLAALPEGDKE